MNKIKRIISICLVVAIIAVSMCNIAYAYVLNGAKISSQIIYKPYSGLGATTKTHMSSAVTKWNSAAGRSLMAISSTTHTATNYPKRDYANLVYKVNMYTSSYVGQNTFWYTTSTGVILESDIVQYILYFR